MSRPETPPSKDSHIRKSSLNLNLSSLNTNLSSLSNFIASATSSPSSTRSQTPTEKFFASFSGLTSKNASPNSYSNRDVLKSVNLVPNVDERIIFCIDLDEENNNMMKSPDGYDVPRIELTKTLIKRYVHMKLLQKKSHQFGILLLNEGAELFMSPSSDVNLLFAALDGIFPTGKFTDFDMGLFYREMSEHFGIPNSDSNELTRVIFLYSRSNVMVKFKGSDADGVELFKRFHSCGKYFFDCIYLHEKPNEDSNPQDVYDSLTAVESQEGLSYFFEVTRSWRRFYLAVTSLLAHPLQRPKQSSADYFLN